MEPVEAVDTGLPQNAFYLRCEAEARWRSVPRVHLEILDDRIHAVAEHLKQGRVGRLGRQHPTRQQHDAMVPRRGRCGNAVGFGVQLRAGAAW